MTVKKKAVFALLVLAIAGLLGLVVTELALRTSYGKIEKITGVAEWSPTKSDGPNGYIYGWDKYHSILGWTNLPGFHGDATIPYPININSQGLRGTKDYMRTPPQGVTRIAVFGDSCVFGEEVDDDQTIPVHLERWLPGTEVLNFGVHGYGLGQMMLRLEQEGLDFNPVHVVFVVLLPSDIARDRVENFCYPKPVFNLDGSALSIRNTPVPVASNQPWLFRHCFTAARLFGRLPSRVEKPELRRLDESLDVARLILERVRTKCGDRGISVTVVAIVVPPRIDEARRDFYAAALINQMCRSFVPPGMDFLDLLGKLEQVYKKHGSILAAPCGHWNGSANCLIAHWIAEHLAAGRIGLSLSTAAPSCGLIDKP